MIGFLSGAAVRMGFAGHQQKEGNRLWTTHRIAPGPRRASRLERNLRLVRALGLRDAPIPDGGLPASEDATGTAQGIVATAFGERRPYAVLAPAASRGQAYKKPPASLLTAAAGELSRRGTGALVVYGPGETADAEAVVRAAPEASRLAPPTGIGVLTELLRHAALFVGGDTGPMHLACAVGCPVVALYGPTDPVVNAPWGVPFEALHPPGREYTGIKGKDRSAGGFEGLDGAAVEAAVIRILARTEHDGRAARVAERE